LNELVGFVEMFWPFLVLIAVFYVFMYRPQKKQEKERNAFLSSLKKGDHVITAGGIYGTIRSIRDNTAMLEIAPKVVITIDKASVMRSADAAAEEKPAEKPEKKSGGENAEEAEKADESGEEKA